MALNDYFINQINNPTFTPLDFEELGFNADNTSLQSEDTYKKLNWILQNPVFQTNGLFDEKKFHEAYTNAALMYNAFTNDDVAKKIGKSTTFFRNNIFAPIGQIDSTPEFNISRQINPMRQKTGIVSFNRQELPDFSAREIAETMPVLTNPIEFANGEKPIWSDSPNEESLFSNLFKTRVLALWDFDADINGNPTNNPDEIYYHKGDKKLNSKGTYYYEDLEGRSVYGKDVLSKWDTLTTDGTSANKFDFFDSDDLKKGKLGSLSRAAVLIVPAFIPGVSSWYIGARIALASADVFSKLGKMIFDSDNSTLSAIEGFDKSLSFSTSDWSLGFSDSNTDFKIDSHAWAFENIAKMAADVFTQLKEQRWIFDNGPKLFGKKILSDTEAKLLIKLKSDEIYKELLSSTEVKAALKNKNIVDWAFYKKKLADISAIRALKTIESEIKDAYKVGEELSKLYMTGVTVADAYIDAKQAGLEDWKAGLFMLGYASGEYMILNSDLGKMILPELRLSKAELREAIKELGLIEKQNLPRQTIAKKIVDFGRRLVTGKKVLSNAGGLATEDIAIGSPSAVGMTINSLIANALGEGTEEVVEEAWLDIAKGIHNALDWMSDGNNKIHTNWTNAKGEFDFKQGFNDYALNFVGGFIGGGIGQGLPEFRAALKIQNSFDSSLSTTEERKQKAWEIVSSALRNGLKKDILKIVQSTTFADPHLSSSETIETQEGLVYKPGNDKDNQDLQVKKNFEQLLDSAEDILNANGGSLSDDSLLDVLAGDLKDIRFSMLLNSSAFAFFLQDYNTATAQLLVDEIAKKQLIDNSSDELKRGEEYNNKIKELDKKIKLDREQILSYLTDDAKTLLKDIALFEMDPLINSDYLDVGYIRYAESISGKKWKDIPSALQEEYKLQYANIVSSGLQKDKILRGYLTFRKYSVVLSDMLKKHGQQRGSEKDSFVHLLSNMFSAFLTPINLSDDNAAEIAINAFFNNLLGTNSKELALLYVLSNTNLVTEEEKNKINILLNSQDELTDEELIAFGRDPANKDAIKKSRLVDELLLTVASKDGFFKKMEDSIKDIKYVDHDVKSFLLSITDRLSDAIFNNGNDNVTKEADDFHNKLIEKNDNPLLEVMDLFTGNISNESIVFSQIIKKLDSLLTTFASNLQLELFGFDNDIQEQIDFARGALQLVRSQIIAARRDSSDIDNAYSYNLTINELKKNDDLAVIDKDVADSFLKDINNLLIRLDLYEKVNNLNTSKKIKESNKMHAKSSSLFFKKIRTIISILEKDPNNNGFQGLDKLKATLEKTKVLPKLVIGDLDLDLSLDDKILLEKDRILLRDAIYDFFQNEDNLNNLDKLFEITLDDKESQEIFESLLSHGDLLFDLQSKDIDVRSFIYELSAMVAMRSSEYYKNYLEIIKDSPYAATSLQERALFNTIAYLTDKKGVFKKFRDALNNALKREIDKKSKSDPNFAQSLSDNFDLTVDTDGGIDDLVHSYLDIWLNEGAPGTGKSTAVDSFIVLYLEKFLPDLLENVFVVNNTAENAKTLAENLKLKNFKSFSYDLYVSYISGSSVNPQWKTNSDEYKLAIEKVDGLLLYKNRELNRELETNKPTLVIIDEISGLSLQDLLLHQKIGVKTIASGDFDLSGITLSFYDETYDPEGNLKAKEGEELQPNVYTRLHRNNFMHGIKLSLSFRTNNMYKDYNTTLLRLRLNEMIRGTSIQAALRGLNLFYYQDDETGLYGDKITQTITKSIPENIKDDIKLMINTLKDGEKLNFLYSDESSLMYTYLQELKLLPEYKDKIDIIELSAAQGNEGLYYVIDLGNKKLDRIFGNRVKFFRDLYTGMTRSKQGSLIIGRTDLSDVSYMKEEKPISTELSKGLILNNNKERIDVLSSEGVLNPIQKQKEKEKIDKNTNNEGDDSGNDLTSTVEGESDDITDVDKKHEEIQKDNNEKQPLILNPNSDAFNMIAYSFITQETGLEKDADGIYIVNTKFAHDENGNQYGINRIDNIYGLLGLGYKEWKVDNKGHIIKKDGQSVSNDEIESAVHELRTIVYSNNKSDIIKQLKQIIPSIKDDEIKISFALKKVTEENSRSDTLYNKGLRFFKSSKEFIYGLKPDIKSHHNDFIMIVSKRNEENKELNIFEIPIMTLPSPFSMLDSNGFEEIKKIYDRLDGLSAYERLTETIKQAKAHNNEADDADKIKTIEIFELLYNVFTKSYNNDTIVYLEDDFDIANNFRTTGPVATTIEKGKHNNANDFAQKYFYNGEWMNLSELVKLLKFRTFSKNVFTSKIDIKDSKGNVVIKKGKPFVLISDLKFRNDTLMIDYLVKEQINKDTNHEIVSVIYVSPPKASLSQYFYNFNKLFTLTSEDGEEIDPSIGNYLSSLRLYKYLIYDQVKDKTLFYKDYIKKWDGVFASSGRFKNLSEKIGIINKYLEDILGLEPKLLIEEIKKTFDDLNKVYKNSSLKGAMQYVLRLVMLAKFENGNINYKQEFNNGFFTDAEIQKRINDAEKILLNTSDGKKIDGIFYHMNIDPEQNEINGLDIMKTDGNYSLNGGNIQVNGKIDSCLIIGDFKSLLVYLSDKLNNMLFLKESKSRYMDNNDFGIKENTVNENELFLKSIQATDKIKSLLFTRLMSKISESKDNFKKTYNDFLKQNNLVLYKDHVFEVELETGDNISEIQYNPESINITTLKGKYIFNFDDILKAINDDSFSLIANVELSENTKTPSINIENEKDVAKIKGAYVVFNKEYSLTIDDISILDILNDESTKNLIDTINEDIIDNNDDEDMKNAYNILKALYSQASSNENNNENSCINVFLILKEAPF